MQTYLIQRAVPAAFDHADPAVRAQHCRWATDTYKQVGAFWIGGVVTDDGMFSVVTTDRAADLDRYAATLGFPPGDTVVRRVIRPLGPYFAQPLGQHVQ